MNEKNTQLQSVFNTAVEELIFENRVAKVGEVIMITSSSSTDYKFGETFEVESHYDDIAVFVVNEDTLVFHDEYIVIVDGEPQMNFGDMLAWTNRLKEIRAMKSNHLKRQRMYNLNRDFLETYDSIDQSKDASLIRLYETIQSDFYKYT